MAVNRISGLSSGIDYETIIKKLMTAESSKLDKMKQKRQIYQWKQETYRDINTSLSALKTEAYNLKLSSSYNIYSAASDDTTVVSAEATSSASKGTYSVKVKQLATTTQKTNTVTSAGLKSSAAITDFNVSGKDFSITFEGTTKTISWLDTEGSYTSLAELQAGIQAKIDNAFGDNQITASTTAGGGIQFEAANTVYKSNISVNAGTTSDALAQMYFADGSQSHISLNTKLQDLNFANGSLTFDTDGKLKFSINGSDFAIDQTATLQTLITTVNNDANADVTMGYDSAKDLIYVKRKSSGAGKDITFTDGTGSNFASTVGLGAAVQGVNAIFDFIDSNGLETLNIEKATNSVSIAGLSLSLIKADTTEYKTVTVSNNTDEVYEKINNFVTKYNETLIKINTKLREARDYDYDPLTDSQKEEMTDEQIESWETKVKEGLVSGDSALEGIVRNLRHAMINPVSGVDSNYNQLSEFGIKTSTDYTSNGLLVIDETKLKEVLNSNPDAVIDFFSTTPANLSGTALSGTVDVEGKSFVVNINSSIQEITLSGSYDLSTSDGKKNMITEINNKLNATLGTNQILATFNSESEIVFSSPKGNSFTLNSGTTNDALSVLGFTDGDTYDSSQKGVISQVYDKLTISITSLISRAGASTSTVVSDSSTIGKWISDIDEKIDAEEERLKDVEDRYYAKFTQMETYINKMNSQSSWLSQQTSSSS